MDPREAIMRFPKQTLALIRSISIVFGTRQGESNAYSAPQSTAQPGPQPTYSKLQNSYSGSEHPLRCNRTNSLPRFWQSPPPGADCRTGPMASAEFNPRRRSAGYRSRLRSAFDPWDMYGPPIVAYPYYYEPAEFISGSFISFDAGFGHFE